MADDLKDAIAQNAEGGKSDSRQRSHGAGGVGEVEVGVDVHGQADVAVTHQLLGRGGGDAVAGQEGGEGVAEAMDDRRVGDGRLPVGEVQ